MVLNPVRAGMVADAAAWPWSSYGAMVGTAQKAAMAAAYATGDYTLQEIATCFGVHYSTVSRAVKRAEHDALLDCKT